MKSFGLFVSLALALSVSAAPQNNRQGGNRGGNNNNGQNQNGQNQNGQNQNGQNNGGNNGGDPQKSLTLDPKVIAAGFAKNGQEVPAAGQVASLTSTNNYINFCLTSPNTPITDGKQVQGGSCNPTPMGLIPSIDRQPSSKFVSPKNLDNIAANTPFTVQMVVSNLKTGNFVNAQSNYYSAPQQLDGSGTIIGHTHITIEALTSLQQTTATEPKKFAFFKGVNGAADGQGIVTVEVDKGLPAGAYRCCSINTNANHGPVVGPVAQRGSFDDCVYWTVGGNGQQNNGQNNGQQNNGQQNNGQQNNGQQNNGQQNNGQQNNGQQNNGQQNNGQQNNGQQQQNGQQGQNNGQQNNGRFGRGRFGGRRNRSL